MARLSRPKAKGDAYEREIAAHINSVVPAHPCGPRLSDLSRALLSGGGSYQGGFDIVGARFAHATGDIELGIEAKRTEKLAVRSAVEQAERARQNLASRGADVSDILPVVVSRRNHEPIEDSLVVLRLSNFLRLLGA